MNSRFVVSSLIEKGFRLIKTVVSDFPTQNYRTLNPSGFDSYPLKDEIAFEGRTETRAYILGYLQKAYDGLQEGESVVFSKTSSGVKASVLLKNNGDIEIEGYGTVTINGNLTIEK